MFIYQPKSAYSILKEPESWNYGKQSEQKIRELCYKKMSAIYEIIQQIESDSGIQTDIHSHVKSLSDICEAILKHFDEDYKLKLLEIFNLLMLMLNEFRNILFFERDEGQVKVISQRTIAGYCELFLYYIKYNELEYFDEDLREKHLTDLEKTYYKSRIKYIDFLNNKKLQKLSIDNKLNNFMAFTEEFRGFSKIKDIRNDVQHKGNISKIMNEKIPGDLICGIISNFIYKLTLRIERLLLKK